MKSATYGFYARTFHEAKKVFSHVVFSQFSKWELVLVLNLHYSQVY